MGFAGFFHAEPRAVTGAVWESGCMAVVDPRRSGD